jgi:hypothetical protein
MAFPFVTWSMTLLAIPFGVSTGRRGALYAVGLGIILAAVLLDRDQPFVALGKSARYSRHGSPPWSPNIIVLGASRFLFLTVTDLDASCFPISCQRTSLPVTPPRAPHGVREIDDGTAATWPARYGGCSPAICRRSSVQSESGLPFRFDLT